MPVYVNKKEILYKYHYPEFDRSHLKLASSLGWFSTKNQWGKNYDSQKSWSEKSDHVSKFAFIHGDNPL